MLINGFLRLMPIVLLILIIGSIRWAYKRTREWKAAFEIAQSLWLTIAVVVGGWWTYYQFVLQRADVNGLDIDMAISFSSYEDAKSIVFLDCAVKNVGKTWLCAKPRQFARGKRIPASEDSKETHLYSVGLKLWRIKGGLKDGTHIEMPDVSLELADHITDEINLLQSYEFDAEDGRVDFWLEPGEVYHLASSVILPPGHYLASVAFIGRSSEDEFWRREFYIRVPNRPKD